MLNSDELMSLPDEELSRAYKGSQKAYAIICSRYTSLIMKKAKSIRKIDKDYDDLIQEGYIALFKAFETYRSDMDTKFSHYASVCITNQITTALYKSGKSYVTDYVDFDEINESINSKTPESIVLEKEKMQEMYFTITEILSKKEWLIFRLFLTGCSYNQISVQLKIPQKVVDNALQRVRRKLKSVWTADNQII